jgi:multiple antibiotic resistance protein
MDATAISTAAASAFLGLFAMMNPIGNTPIFMSVTDGISPAARRGAALRAGLAVLVILVGSIFGATAILDAFGISMNAFEAAGGVIVLGIGLRMLGGGDNPAHTTPTGSATVSPEEEVQRERSVESKIIVPLAMPILAGPGSITTVVTVAAANHSFEGHIGTAIGTAALVAIMTVCFMLSGVIARAVGSQFQEILLRFMGMILVAIAVGMIFSGTVGGLADYVKAHGAELRAAVEAKPGADR